MNGSINSSMNRIIKNIGCLLIALCFSVSCFAKIEFVEFKDAKVKDAAKILSSMTGANIAVTKEASDESVNLLLQNTDLKNAIDLLSRVAGLWYRYNRAANSYIIMTEQQYQDDIVVFRDDIIRTFTLKHQNVTTTALTVQSLFGDRVRLTLQNETDGFDGLELEFGDENDATTIEDDDDDNGEIEFQDLDRQNLADQRQTDLGESQLSTGKLRELGAAEKVDADAADKLIGAGTPIFIATNRIHNLLHVRTSDENAMAEIARLIEDSDKPTPQVLLEMKIVRIEVGERFDKDFDLSFNDALNVRGANLVVPGQVTAQNFNPATATVNANNGSVNAVTRALSQLSGNSGNAVGFIRGTGGFYEFFSRYVNARINYFERNNQAEVVAKPVLMASNNRPARLFIGSEQVVPVSLDTDTNFSNANADGDRTSTTTTTLQTERRRIGNTLILLPSINADRTVTIDIFQDTSAIQEDGLSFPFFNNTNNTLQNIALDAVQQSTVQTVVVAKDGNTIALGGMINKNQTDTETVVPLLGQIPLFGEFFRSQEKRDESSQYVILITPHVLLSPEEGVEKSQGVNEFEYELTRDGEGKEKRDYAVVDYISLVRYAAKVGHKERVIRPVGLRDVPVSNTPLSFVFDDPDISVWPLGGWQQSGLFVTLLKARNLSDKKRELDFSTIPGRWLATAGDHKQLSPFGKQKDQTQLYFVSDRPFDQVVADVNKRVQRQ